MFTYPNGPKKRAQDGLKWYLVAYVIVPYEWHKQPALVRVQETQSRTVYFYSLFVLHFGLFWGPFWAPPNVG